MKREKGSKLQWLVPVAALAVLGAMEAWKASLPDESVGRPYRNKIKADFADYSLRQGDWEGRAVELPKEAVKLLHPNFYFDRVYVNRKTADQAELMFIEVEDTRDMMGHYPPNCYPGNGWDLVGRTPASNGKDGAAEWVVARDDGKPDLRIKGTEYEFHRGSAELGEEKLWVRSFFILPNNTFYADLATFGRAAADFNIRPYGATQVQVIYRREMPPADRERIFQSLMKAHMTLLDAVRTKD